MKELMSGVYLEMMFFGGEGDLYIFMFKFFYSIFQEFSFWEEFFFCKEEDKSQIFFDNFMLSGMLGKDYYKLVEVFFLKVRKFMEREGYEFLGNVDYRGSYNIVFLQFLFEKQDREGLVFVGSKFIIQEYLYFIFLLFEKEQLLDCRLIECMML